MNHAQTQIDLRQPAPAIKFPDWTLGDEGDFANEYLVSFPSAYTSPYPVNNIVPLRVMVPTSGKAPFPVILITHYWGARDLRAEQQLALDLNRKGVAAAILTLPYHLSRTPAGYKSGDLAIQPDPQKLIETMDQSILDVKRSLDFLMSRPEFRKDHVGIAGTSLGALVASLAYGVDSRITHATFVLGGVDFAKILWSSSRVVKQRDVLRRKGYTEDRLRTELAPVEPLNYLPRSTPGKTFVVVGRYDTVIPGGSSTKLIESLDHPAVLTLDTGHYGGIFVERKILREVSTFFASEMNGSNYAAPKKLVAPTIRIGVIASTAQGMDLGAGLDLFRLDIKGERFGTLFFTPRGTALFLGQKIAQGMSVGLVGTTRKVGVGLFWSTVL